jgi:site-specific DNA-methyltransferase (adenine-specific)
VGKVTHCTLYNADCLEAMRDIPDGSVDMVLTDPPYGTTACKWDSVIPFKPMWAQLKRITKPNGAIVLTASQPFTSALIMSNVKMFKYCWVWHKRAAANGVVAKFQPLKTHEDIVVFSGAYKPQMVTGKPRMKGGKKASSGVANGSLAPLYHKSDQYYPVSVLDFKVERGLHPTQKPVALMEYLIRTYTNQGETVLDFTMGSGTTGVACKNLSRSFIGIEMDADYFSAASKRIDETTLLIGDLLDA